MQKDGCFNTLNTPPYGLDAWEPVAGEALLTTQRKVFEHKGPVKRLPRSFPHIRLLKVGCHWSSMQMLQHLWNKTPQHRHPTTYITTEVYPSSASVRISLLHICDFISILWEWMNARKTRYLAHCSCHYTAHRWRHWQPEGPQQAYKSWGNFKLAFLNCFLDLWHFEVMSCWWKAGAASSDTRKSVCISMLLSLFVSYDPVEWI